MKRASLAAIVLLAVGIGHLLAEQPTEERLRPATDRLIDTYYAALKDPQAGRLDPLVAKLLMIASALPKEIQLPVEPANGKDPGESPPQQNDATPDVAVPPHEEWRQVVPGPVVDDGKYAWVLYRAGSYAEAAAIYRRLLKADEKDEHALVMLALSERNAGNAAEARRLIDTLSPGSPTGEWAEWMLAMADLAASARARAKAE